MALVRQMLRTYLPRDAWPIRRVASHSPAHSPLNPPVGCSVLRFLHPRYPSTTVGKEFTMPFQTQGDDPLDAKVDVRLTTAEKTRLREEADLAGLGVSGLMRRRAFGRPIVAHADQVMIRELRRLGGLLKHVHTTSGGAYSQETAAALRALKAAIERLSDDRQKG